MAFRSNGPITLSLPAFRGVTRRLILLALVSFFGLAVIGLISQSLELTLLGLLALTPSLALGHQIWQLVTYPFVGGGLLGTAFALLSVWYFGSTLEDERGGRWLLEYFLTATVGGGVFACLLWYAGRDHVAGFAEAAGGATMWPTVLALLLAFARFHAEEQVRFNFIFQIKAKYLAAVYLLFYLGWALIGGNKFAAVLALANALAGYGYLRFAPRGGLRLAVSEGWFGVRNAWYRRKRRRAAKKFTVYMRKQGKEVSLDADGNYVEPKPTDRNWMN
jgi:membrane associated rhomboid family serine protease